MPMRPTAVLSPASSDARVGRLFTLAAATTVALAGLIHLVLIPEHFEEQFAYGVIFTAMAMFQLHLALVLTVRPGPGAYRAGIWGSGLIALVYVATRLAPPPGSDTPEEVNAIGVVATALELAAVILLAVALPDAPASRPHVAPVWWGVGGALLTAPLWLIATGSLVWTDFATTSWLSWYGERSPITPALVGAPLPHLWLFAPWWVLLGAVGLAALVGLNLWLATRLVGEGRLSCRARRAGLLALIPAAFAAPLCCGAPLAALFGIPVLLRFKVAPLTMVLSLLLLAANLAWLWARARRQVTC
jgi:hypothetical protein